MRISPLYLVHTQHNLPTQYPNNMSMLFICVMHILLIVSILIHYVLIVTLKQMYND